jgi:A/G-specific adenine glycosylase
VPTDFTRSERRELASRLLAWYRASRRDLPWRRTRDPYAIWVSEVMLQQTRVETVKPYWERFLARFPTVEALAAAPVDDVLGLWSGLGYYARARALHRAAVAVAEDHGGALPATAEGLSALPGFGPYTTAAVGSIAYGLPLAVVDGNVARVLARWTCTPGDSREPAAMARWRQLAQELLPEDAPGDFNQALMELGATLCGPSAEPACLVCPVASLCRARAAGKQGEIPARRKAKERPRLRWAVALVRRGDGVLLARRPDEGLFASLWELPGVEVAAEPKSETSPGEREALAAALADRLGVEAAVGDLLGEAAQTLSHRELTVAVYAATVPPRSRPRARAFYTAARFADPDAAPGGVSSVTRKALRAVAPGAPGRAARRAASRA